jgi:transposase
MTADALGRPLRFCLTGAEEADITQASELLEQDMANAKAVVADKGYDADSLVNEIKAAGAKAVIPPRSNRKTKRRWDKRLYQGRHLIENLFAHLKQFRRVATRYDKLAVRYAAFICLACFMIWLNQL